VHYSKAKVDATLMQLTASGSNFTVSITNSDFICEETLFFESKVIEDIAKIESKPLLSPSAINAKGLKYFVNGNLLLPAVLQCPEGGCAPPSGLYLQ
jgi:hypothetical protein